MLDENRKDTDTVKQVAGEARDFIDKLCKSDAATISTVLAILVASIVFTFPRLRWGGFMELFDVAVNELATDMDNQRAASDKDAA